MQNNFDDLFKSPAVNNKTIPQVAHQPLDVKKNQREEAFKLIDNALDLIRADEDKLSDMLDVISRFGNYSLGNMMLIFIQKPNSEKIEDIATWASLGVNVKKGEHGFLLLKRGKEYIREFGSMSNTYYAKTVYDVSQTDSTYKYVCRYTKDSRELIKALMNESPVPIRLDNSIDPKEVAKFDWKKQEIVVAGGLEAEQLIPSLCQELTHANIYFKNDEVDYERDHYEFIAKCVSYIVCDRIGVVPVKEKHPIPEHIKLNRTTLQSALALIRRLASRQTLRINNYFD